MIIKIKKKIIQNLVNRRGWSTNKKIVVFESDDWGSIRMPSKKAFNNLLKSNIRVDKSQYDSLDCLENRNDLNDLFSVLLKYHGSKKNFPIFTFNTVMGNPNFDKIRESNFEKFYHESLFDSYLRYNLGHNQQVWKEAIDKRVMKPQFHAREHLNVNLWMNDLKSNHRDTKVAFENNFFGLKTKTSSPNQLHYLAAYQVENMGELQSLKSIVEEGLHSFEQQFGFKSQTLIPCNYIWPSEIEPLFSKLGVSSIQGQRVQIAPDINENGKKKIIRHYSGQRNLEGQIYTVRNVKFEPFEDSNLDWVDKALKEIQNAFFWKKPAIISTHRINYVGSMDINNRDRNLRALEALINKIIKRWPNIEFLSSNELAELVINSK